MFEFGASHNQSEIAREQMRHDSERRNCVSSEMSKCLTLVHLTTVFRIDSVVRADSQVRSSGFPLFTTALMGECLRLVGSVPAATGAIGAVGLHWPCWPPGRLAYPTPSEPDWTSVFVEAQRRSVCQLEPSLRSADSPPIEILLRLPFLQCCWRRALA